MIILVISLSVVVVTIWVFHRNAKAKTPHLEIVEMEWSPLNIDWLDRLEFLCKNQFSIADKTGRAVHPYKECSPCFSELFDELSSPADPEPDVVRQKPDYFAFPGAVWEENHSEHAAVALGCPVSPSDRVLDRCDSNFLVPACSQILN